jgi:hypothetical protein
MVSSSLWAVTSSEQAVITICFSVAGGDHVLSSVAGIDRVLSSVAGGDHALTSVAGGDHVVTLVAGQQFDLEGKVQ